MRAAPIMHTRTYHCDFNAEFMVRPEQFRADDINRTRKYVLEATDSIDSLQGERWLVVDDGRYRTAGVVGFLKDICTKCDLTEEQKIKSQELFCDDKGRLVYAFIGLVIDISADAGYGNITCNDLWGIYLDAMHPIWQRTFQEVITKKFEDMELGRTRNNSLPSGSEPCAIGGRELYESNPATDYDLFLYHLNKRNKNNYSFCTNMADYNKVRQSAYSIITTSQNNITRLKRDNASAHNINPVEQQMQKPDTLILETTNTENEVKKKDVVKDSVILPISVIILLIIILILLLVIGNIAYASQMNATTNREDISKHAKLLAIVSCLSRLNDQKEEKTMRENKPLKNCFDEFKDDISPKRKEPGIQALYEYEKHYLEMLKKYSNEIQFIEGMLRDFRKEQEQFYGKALPDIKDKLDHDEGIDEEMKKVWLNRLSENMERSFALSEQLINHYTTKKLDEFKAAVDEKMRNI